VKAAAVPPVRISVGRRGLHLDELSALLGVESARVLNATAGLVEGDNAADDKILSPEVIELVVESLNLSSRVILEQSKPLWNNSTLTCKANPVISIMGHVDHGKTSLLDSLRGKGGKVVQTVEHGGITQSIGAFQVGNLTFIDTPGHAAFSNMRQRGSIATDIIVLVIAADDGIMPQTLEVINLAKISNVPIIVAINKIDKAGADGDRIRAQLLEVAGINSEQTGGDTLCVEVSAKNKVGLDQLLESITLQAEMLPEPSTTPTTPGTTSQDANTCMVCIESNCDRSMGNIASVIVRAGKVKVGDFILFHDDDILAGDVYGKIRSLIDVNGNPVQEADAGAAVGIVGIRQQVPPGSMAVVVRNEKEAKKESKSIIARNQRILATVQNAQQKLAQLKAKDDELSNDSTVDHEDASAQEVQENDYDDKLKGTLNVLVKGDVQGSSDAVANCLRQLSTRTYGIRVISTGMGPVNQADILLASATTKYKRRTDDSIIVGFNVKTPNSVLSAAKKVHVDVLNHQLIYELEDAVRERVSNNLMKWETTENVVGSAKVLRVFNDGAIGGLVVNDGKIIADANNNNSNSITQTKVWRTNKDDHERVCVHTGTINTLKHLAKDIRVAEKGTECGVAFEDWSDFEAGDIIECSEIIKGENVA